ncbi:MAG: WbqC family protein [Ardenticatenaceae bacterium]|nr:WbqC family protein [Ardenticatenaceae bacterium]
MKLGIMQPYFFPYLGYFDLINYVDKWIVFDTVQYIRHGWINRNRILHPQEGWLYIVVPVKPSRDSYIRNVTVDNGHDWKQRIIGQLGHYKRKAPYFHETVALVRECLDPEETSISRLNTNALSKVCERLGIGFDYRVLSEMDIELGPVEGPGDWALRISEALGAEEYVNPPGGVDIFDEAMFAASNIKLTFRRLPPLEYTCRGYEFIPNLSIIDLLMWNKPEFIKGYLDEHRYDT